MLVGIHTQTNNIHFLYIYEGMKNAKVGFALLEEAENIHDYDEKFSYISSARGSASKVIENFDPNTIKRGNTTTIDNQTIKILNRVIINIDFTKERRA